MNFKFDKTTTDPRELVAFCDYFLKDSIETIDEITVMETLNMITFNVFKYIDSYLMTGRSSQMKHSLVHKDDKSEFSYWVTIIAGDKDINCEIVLEVT